MAGTELITSDLHDDLRSSMLELTENNNESKNLPATTDSSTGTELERVTEERTGGDEPAERTGHQRDASGRFAPREPAKSVPANSQQKAAPAKVADQQQVQQYTGAERAPVSWKPQLREKWAGLDNEVKLEILRRERQIEEGLRESAESRKFQQEFAREMQPFQQFFAADGVTPLQAAVYMLKLGAIARAGSPRQKVDLIVDSILRNGIDVQLLDQVLTQALQGGGPLPYDANPRGGQRGSADVSAIVRQELAPVMSFMQQFTQMQQQSEQRLNAQAEQTLEQFIADPQNEFALDVAEDMADLLELAARRGQKLSLQDAYSRATLAHPQIGAIIAQRKVAKVAEQQTTQARQARQAAASVSGTGAPSQSADESEGDGSVRSDLLAAMNSLNQSR